MPQKKENCKEIQFRHIKKGKIDKIILSQQVTRKNNHFTKISTII